MLVFGAAPPNMRAIWDIAQLHGDKPYVIFEDERYTYAEIGAQVRSLAHYLRDVHGVGAGDRVAIVDAQLPRVDRVVLGGRVDRRRAGRDERLVDERRR